MKIKRALLVGAGVITVAAVLWLLYEKTSLDDLKLDFTERLD